ncbi:sigma-70 family RNA polymerase sigma factor [Sediminispirochaeta smaragdinae]|jgi:RNA polymerase primary sigma factor|uniref:RNA polymerase, sigma 70 subunit, RpoD subfamily n=1 Tax=Sediminispirochaeta smaragdinae (strain DSM 11293 / JCM 15392 / SEBR 4228) TaxID=573413 RepID=E1R677_SEDSS|nr:RNA polymerase sigma factor RpoD/SigA [Sediminispirochaeta smaragdinae]ADK80842.1 RNA polymerase, sigma 70 subunit, RpoD subfamily [Sediminispirochaeta smaragdinae DSM 11293]
MPTKKNINSRSGDFGNENVISIYLKEINKVPLLSREDEDRYARLAADGDEHAKEMLIKSNLRFVVNVAKKYQNQGLPLADLINEGNIGLMNAIERYDVDKGYHFISYAVWWIRQAILKAISEKARMIRLPLNRANELVQIEKAKKGLQLEGKEEPEFEEIARVVGMDAEHVASLVNISRDLVSLESPIYTDRSQSELGDFIEDVDYKSPDETLMEQSLKEDIAKVLDTLSEKEADIIRHRFGLDGRAPLSLKDIGDRYNLTKERIRQIEKKAIKRLQHPSRRQYLESYIAV